MSETLCDKSEFPEKKMIQCVIVQDFFKEDGIMSEFLGEKVGLCATAQNFSRIPA